MAEGGGIEGDGRQKSMFGVGAREDDPTP